MLDMILPGYGACRIDDVQLRRLRDRRHLVPQLRSPSLSRRDATAPRQPSVRSGPTRCPRASTAQMALLAFFRPIVSADSCAPHDALRKSTANSGSAIGSPASGCPRGTIRVSRAHAARAPTGSARGHQRHDLTGAASRDAASRASRFLTGAVVHACRSGAAWTVTEGGHQVTPRRFTARKEATLSGGRESPGQGTWAGAVNGHLDAHHCNTGLSGSAAPSSPSPVRSRCSMLKLDYVLVGHTPRRFEAHVRSGGYHASPCACTRPRTSDANGLHPFAASRAR